MTADYRELLGKLSLFRPLDAEQRDWIGRLMRRRDLDRGQFLVREGEASDSMFVVLHGSFEVTRAGKATPIAEVHAGELIGEIGFFAGTPRTASTKAIRDAAVLELDRAAYNRIIEEAPSIVGSLLAAVAGRLGATSAKLPEAPRRAGGEKTIAVVSGGAEPVPPAFFDALRKALAKAGTAVIDREALTSRFGNRSAESPEVGEWLNDLELDGQPIIYFADKDLTDWTRKCVRQADSVVIVTAGQQAPRDLNPVERFVADIHDETSRRLVRIHPRRANSVTGTPAWLERLPVFLHHHVSLKDDVDIKSVARFLTGRAVGFVAGGGGGQGSAHVGLFRAFGEDMNVPFDIFGGTSVGSAMMAGFALLHDSERLEVGTHNIFVTSRGLKRPNWPSYALLDHKAFDAVLMEEFGDTTLIEDTWRPYFAVATNLSTQRVEVIRRGHLWKALRASCAVPAILAPLFTEDGMMLVDGGMMDNVPLGPMRSLKAGPNLIVHFGRSGEQRFNVKYEDIPGRGKQILSLLNPFARRMRIPSAMNVLWRSLLVHQRYDMPLDPHDLVMRPPQLPGISLTDFDKHAEIYEASYKWGVEQIAELRAKGDPALAALLAANELAGVAATSTPEDRETAAVRTLGA